MKTRIAIVVLALTAASFARAQESYTVVHVESQEHRNHFEISPFGGYLFGGHFDRGSNSLFTTDVDVDDQATYGARFGYLFNRYFELEFQYSRTESHFVTHNGDQLFGPDAQPLGKLNIDYFLGYMTFNFGHNPHVIPYITLGAGAANLDPTVAGRNASSETKFTASLGGGLRTMFTPHFGLRFDGRLYTTLLDNGDNNNSGCNNNRNNCHDHNNNWLTNGDVTGGLVVSF